MAIGLGVIGMNPTNMGSTATLLKDVPDLKYELRAICAKRAEVLEGYAAEIGVGFWTTDYQELVSRDDIDVVAVYSPDHLHAVHCAAAIEAGKHVVCTKPMVTDLDDAKRLVGLVREKGVKFLVGQTMRFDLHSRPCAASSMTVNSAKLWQQMLTTSMICAPSMTSLLGACTSRRI